MLGLRRRKRCATHGVTGQGARPDLLFFPARGGGELWPGAETDAASYTFPAADDARHTAAADASATDVTSHTVAFTQREAVAEASENREWWIERSALDARK